MAHPDQLTEATRAAAYQAQCVTRAAYRRAQVEALAGDPSAAAAVQSGWAAVRPPYAIPDPPCAVEEDVDLPRPSWLGRVPSDIELPEHLKGARPYWEG